MRKFSVAVPILDSHSELVGAALLAVTFPRFEQIAEIMRGPLGSATLIIGGEIEPDAVVRSEDLPPAVFDRLVNAARGERCPCVLVRLADSDIPDNGDPDCVRGLTDRGRIRAMDLNVNREIFFWTAIASDPESGEDTRVKTLPADQLTLMRFRRASHTFVDLPARSLVRDLIDAAAEVTRCYGGDDRPEPVAKLETVLARILGLSLRERNDIQFPRLLTKIKATQANLDLEALADSMDLEAREVAELFERAWYETPSP